MLAVNYERWGTMRKTVLKSVLATATAFTIAVMPALTVCAEDIDVNPNGSTIDVEHGNKLEENHGTVVNNYGTIVENAEDGTVHYSSSNSIIETNKGNVHITNGTVNTNSGTIEWFGSRTMETNNGEIIKSIGTVKTNNNSIKENHGTVITNNGTVENNFGDGTVGGPNAPEHQWYMVDLDGAFNYDQLSIELEGSNWYEDRSESGGYLEAGDDKSGDFIIVAKDGYRITTGDGQQQFPDTCICTARQEGNKYIITVSSVTGYVGLDVQKVLNLVFEEIQQQTGGGSSETGTVTVVVDDSVSVVSGDNSSSSASSEPASYSAIPAGAVTISLPKASAETAVAGPSVLGAERVATRTASIKVAQISNAQYKETIIGNINATPAGGMLRIETDRISCFDKAMLEAFARKSNIDLEVLFPIGGRKMKVIIPAGFDINKLLDEKGYCGFLRLLAILGGEVVAQ